MLSEKFQTEAAILDKIRHANIVSILDKGESEDRSGREFRFITLEFMAGGDLMEHKRTLPEQKLDLAETLYFLLRVRRSHTAYNNLIRPNMSGTTHYSNCSTIC